VFKDHVGKPLIGRVGIIGGVKMKKKLKFAFSLALTIILTGILQLGLAVAASSLAELSCTSQEVVVQPNSTVKFNIDIDALGNLSSTQQDPTTVQIDTYYTLNAGSKSSSIKSASKKFYTDATGPYTIPASVYVSKDTTPGEYLIPIKSYVTNPNKHSVELADAIVDYVKIKVEDNAPPTIVFTTQPNSWTNTGSVSFAWKGSDNATADANLVYSCKLNDNPWIDYSSNTTTILNGLEDNNYTFYVKAKDESGSESNPIQYTFGIDTTSPVVTASADRLPNVNGWYNSDVIVSFAATDNLSGVSSFDPPVTVSTEGSNQQITGSATDVASNIGHGSVAISLDKTAPSIMAVVPDANANEWYNTDVIVGFNAEDTLSGVDSITAPVTITNEGKDQDVTGKAVDKAGNEATAQVTVNIDKTEPTVTADATTLPNANGWYNSDVTFNLSATDNLSGVASVDTPVTVSTEGANQLVPGFATDKAGNIGRSSATVNIDETAPDLTVNGIIDGGVYTLNQAINASWMAIDALSGVDSVVPSSPAVDTSSVGTKTFSVTATDKAGNVTIKTVKYSVVYKFGGILQPINSDGSSVFKLGSTIPVKFQLTDANVVFVSTAQANKIFYAKITNSVVGTDVEAVSTSNATTGNLFRYDSVSNQYIFNLSTKSGFTAGTYQISIILDDGSTAKTVQISLK
jgi:hypothetical protein